MSNDFRERAGAVICGAFGGEHHVNKLTWIDGQYPRCEFQTCGPMATWDYNELTALVVAAHDECVRAEVRPAPRNTLKVILSDRVRSDAGHPMIAAHPLLEDHVQRLRGLIDSDEFGRRLKGVSP